MKSSLPRILHLDLGGEYRGGQRQVLMLAERLQSGREYHPVIATQEGAPLLQKAEEQGIETYGLRGGREWSVPSLIRLTGFMRRSNIRMLHTHDARAASVAALIRAVSSRKWKLVHTRRVSYPIGTGWSFKKYALADMVAAVSNEIASLLAHSGLPPERLTVIPSGINLKKYRPNKGFEKRRVSIGIIGALTAQKGHSVLLQSLHILKGHDSLPEWHARVIGSGPLMENLRQEAQTLSIGDRVTFEGFLESREVLPGLDILVVPSVDGEGSSGVIREGWAAGVPVVVSDLSSNIEMVQHRINGLVFPRGNVRALAAALRDLMDDADLKRALATIGLKSVAAYTDHAMAQAYSKLYASLLSRDQAP